MIICTNCGNHNEDSDEFCGSCGKFLEWVGQKVEDPVTVEAAEPEPEMEDTKVGLIDRVKAAVGIEGAAGGGAGTTVADAPPLDGIGVDEPVDPQIEAERTRAAAVAEEQERARLEADAADQAARERRAVEDAERAERERQDAEAAAAAAAAAQAAAEAAAREAADEQARLEAETWARERAAAEAQAAAEQAERDRVAAEAAAADSSAAEETEQERLRGEARAATAQAERDRVAAEAGAAAAAAAREAEEQARREAEEAAAKARAEEEARRAAEAEEQRRKADEERARREAEARAEAARRAAALLAQPKTPAPEPAAGETAPPATDSTSTTAAATTPVTPVAPVAPAPPKRGPTAPPGVRPGPEPGAQPAAAAQAPSAMAPSQAPAKPKAPPKPATQIKADDGPKPGDLICDSCGTGNDPARKFCRKCGNSLAKAEPVKKLPWWKRLFSGNKKKKAKGGKGKKAVAGARQASFKAEMAMARLRNAVLILAALGLAGGFMVPSIRVAVMNGARDGINKARDTLFPNFDPVRPTSVSASTEAPDHPAVASADLAVNTYWAEGAEGEGIGQTVTYSFNEPFELAKILVTPGAFDPQQPDLYLKQPRPKDIHLVFDNGASADILVKDEQKAQTFTIKGAKDITSVQLSIASVYPGTGGADTSIAEVEFRKRA